MPIKNKRVRRSLTKHKNLYELINRIIKKELTIEDLEARDKFLSGSSKRKDLEVERYIFRNILGRNYRGKYFKNITTKKKVKKGKKKPYSAY